MIKYFAIEWEKYRNYTTFWVMLTLFAGLFVITIAVAAGFQISFGEFDVRNFFKFPLVWNTVAWFASWFNLLLAILAIIITGNDFSWKIYRQNIIDGLERTHLLTGKYILFTAIGLGVMVLVMLVSLVCGFIYTDKIVFADIFSKSYYLIICFVQSMSYMSMAFFAAVLFRNTSMALVLFIVYFFPLEPILRFMTPDHIDKFFPLKLISDLTPYPSIVDATNDPAMKAAMENQLSQMKSDDSTLSLGWAVLVSFGWWMVFSVSSFFMMKNRNL